MGYDSGFLIRDEKNQIIAVYNWSVILGSIYTSQLWVDSLLLDTPEKEVVTRNEVVDIWVGLYAGADAGYGAAQKLYVKRCYITYGQVVTYNYKPTIPGNSYQLDDYLVLWFTKNVS